MTRRESLPAWPQASLIGAIVTVLTGLAALLLLNAGLDRSTPALETTTRSGAEAVGQAVASQIGHALEIGIPLDRLEGVEPYLQRIVNGSPQVKGLALIDGDGRTLHTTADGLEGLRFPIVIGGVHATLVVVPESFLTDSAVRQLEIALAAAALLAGLVAGTITAGFVTFSQRPARRNLEQALSRVAAGDFSAELPVEGRGRLFDAVHWLAASIEKVTAARRRLAETSATIRAIDFDGSLGRRADQIVEPIEKRYILSAPEERDIEPANGPSADGQVIWRVAVLVGLYASAFPLAANFAMDREPAGIARAWWPIVPLLTEFAAMVIGVMLGSGRSGRFRTAMFTAGAVLGTAFAAAYWCRSYDFFVLLRACVGFAAGFISASLLAGRSFEKRSFLAVLIFSMLIAGPLLSGLLTEADGRRTAFLVVGAAMLVMTPFIAFGAWRGGKPRTFASFEFSVDLFVYLAMIPASALVLIEIPAGFGYDNYLAASGVMALIGFCAFIAPALPASVPAVGLLAAASALWFRPDEFATLLLASAATGFAAGATIKSATANASRVWASVVCAIGTGLLATGSARYLQLPFAIVIGGPALLLIAAGLTGQPNTVRSQTS